LNISRTSGFTLIELVIVIILLGILSAVAILNFILTLDAKNSALRSLKGKIESGLSITHNKMIMDGQSENTDILPKFCNECNAGGTKYYLFDYGYPKEA